MNVLEHSNNRVPSNSQSRNSAITLTSKSSFALEKLSNDSSELNSSANDSSLQYMDDDITNKKDIQKYKRLETKYDNNNRKNSTNKATESPLKDNKTTEIYDETDQLLGKDYGQKMVDIGGNFFCIKQQYDKGCCSGDATKMARHLMDGIFKREALLKCTLTGQAPRAQSAEKQMEKFEPLHFEAREQIIDRVLEEAKLKGWKKREKNTPEPREYLRSDIERTMTQYIGEKKREILKNNRLKEQ
ncbi:unnamed protein product [Euphydryas editha]|uniref:Uncharacterized protein n=1 Tax=Euphydryas editha TaxID=104508 RepID=A0AAU9TFW8_EUPED|nr:unnamed protein product [Euphydryas editha]